MMRIFPVVFVLFFTLQNLANAEVYSLDQISDGVVYAAFSDTSDSMVNTSVQSDSKVSGNAIRADSLDEKDYLVRVLVYDPHFDLFFGAPGWVSFRIAPLFLGFSLGKIGGSIGTVLGEISVPLYSELYAPFSSVTMTRVFRFLPAYFYLHYTPRMKYQRKQRTTNVFDLFKVTYKQKVPRPILYAYLGTNFSDGDVWNSYYRRVGVGIYYQLTSGAGFGLEISHITEDVLINYIYAVRASKLNFGVIISEGAWRSPDIKLELLEDL
ncbi:MAG: hypothetical protein ABIM44_01970 [candidate division WOR-3 bacterium]